MADIYARSTDGSDADNGSTWALAKATLAGAAAIDAAGDTIYVSQAHSESSATAQTIALAGTLANPVRVICANDAAEPPTSAATGAVVATTLGSSITITGSAEINDINFRAGNNSSTASLTMGAGANLNFVGGSLELTGSGSGSRIALGSASLSSVSRVVTNGTNFKFGQASQAITVGSSSVEINGGAILSGTAITRMIDVQGSGRGSSTVLRGFDMSAASSSMNLVSTSTAPALVKFVSCRLPTSWTGDIHSGDVQPGCRVEMWNCDNADTNYRIWIKDPAGQITHSTSVYKTGWTGSDTAHSYVFASNANANELVNRLVGPDFFADNSTTGSSVTATVEIVTDGVTLTDAECWLEVMHMGTSGVPLGAWVSDQRATLLTTAANQTSSSQGWTTTGLTSPVKQKLSVTFTPQEAGYVIGRVVLAKASTTVYVDPELTLT